MNTIEQAIAENPRAVLTALSNVLPEILDKNGSRTNGETEVEENRPKLIDPEKQIEIVDGEVEIKEMAGARHGGIATRIIVKMGGFIEQNKLGGIYGGNTTFTIGENERLPDVSFVSMDRIPSTGEPETKWEIAPDLAVEIVSPTDIYSKILKKIREYLDAGVKQVWLIEPEFQTVTVYTPPMKSETLNVEDSLVCEEILPDFELSLKEIFRSPKAS